MSPRSSRFGSVVPFAVELVPLDRHVGKLFVADFDAGVVGVLVEFGANAQTFLGRDAADEIDYDLALWRLSSDLPRQFLVMWQNMRKRLAIPS